MTHAGMNRRHRHRTAALTEKRRDEFADVQRQAAADRSFTDE